MCSDPPLPCRSPGHRRDNLKFEAEIAALRERFCTRPIQIEPGISVRCGSRRWSQCPSCARLWAGDSARLARSGIFDADGLPVEGFRYFFITLSAPSFGAVHRVPKWEKDKGQRCRCGDRHSHSDTDVRGVPLELDTYDYVGQVRWHQALGRLWNASVNAMRRVEPDLEFFRVYEAQARLALHAHAVVRVPDTTAADASELGRAARNATTKHPLTRHVVSWGQHGVADREIRPRHVDGPDVSPDQSRSVSRTLAYTLKSVVSYSLKDLGHGTPEHDIGPLRRSFVFRLAQAAIDTACPRCTGGQADGCRSRAHRQHGFSGHLLALSRPTSERPGWSFSGLTRGRLREERRVWVLSNITMELNGGLDAAALAVADWVREQDSIRRIEPLETVRMARGPNAS